MHEDKFIKLRQHLINSLKRKGILDNRVLDAMMKVARHEFIERRFLIDPYEDAPQSIGDGQTISQPYIVALMTEYLELTGDETVLELGTGCGYQTAILCELAKQVYSIERIENLYKKSKKNLEKLGYKNYKLKLDDGTLGWEEYAPFDAIIVTATAPDIPEPLKKQLSIGGRMVIPVGKGSPQELVCVVRNTNDYQTSFICGVYFVPLIGKHAWQK
ncbi:MAG: protein-L-isoaspartate(D-aspartate) O-methyltransferase [Cyanobacteriota bacterium]